MASKENKLAIKIAGEIEKSFYNSTKLTRKELENIVKQSSTTSKGVRQNFAKGFDKASVGFEKLSKGATAAFNVVKEAAKITSVAVGGIVTASVAVGASYEAQMSTVQSISGATGAEMVALKEKAKEMGATTKFSATEAGQAMEYMAMAGWKAGDMLDGVEGIMNLAAASGEELGAVSDIVTDALTAFGLKAKDSAHFADILAKASSSSNTNVGMMGETFKYVAPVAGSLGYSAEDAAVAIGLMANSGIKASQSGTSLRAGMVNLVKPTDAMAAVMDQLGIEIANEDGSMKTLMETMEILRDKFSVTNAEVKKSRSTMIEKEMIDKGYGDTLKGLTKVEKDQAMIQYEGMKQIEKMSDAQFKKMAKDKLGIQVTKDTNRVLVAQRLEYELGSQALNGLTQEQQASYAATVFGKNALSGWLSVINASESDFEKLTEQIYNCEGAAQEMADIRLDNLQGDVTILKSGMEGLGIEIYEGISEPLRAGTQFITGIINTISGSLKNTNIISKIADEAKYKLPTAKFALKNFAAEFLKFANPFISLGKWLIKNPNVVVSTLAGIGSVILSYKLANTVKSVATSFASLGSILTNPFAAAITAVGVAIGGSVGIATYIRNLNNEMKRENLAEHFGSIALSMDDLQEAAEHIINTDALGQMQKVLNEFDKKDTYFNSMQNVIDEINKANWKISIGMELTDTEKEAYLSNVTQFISDTKETLLQDQYTMRLAMDIYTQDNADGDKVKKSMNAFYSKMINTVEEEGKKLAKYSARAFEDGMLDVEEATVISKYMQKMAEITKMMSDSEFDAKLSAIQLKYSGAELNAESFQNLQAEINNQVEAAKVVAEDSYIKTTIKYDVAFKAGEMNKETYDIAIQQAKEQYLSDIGDIELKASNFQVDTIMQQYSDELGEAAPEFKKMTEDTVNQSLEQLEWDDRPVLIFDTMFEKIMNSGTLDETAKAALGDLFAALQPSAESLEQLRQIYIKNGMEVPESLKEGITDTAVLGSLVGDVDSIWALVGEAASGEEYDNILSTLQEKGYYIPEKIRSAIEEKKTVVKPSITSLYNQINEDLKSVFSKGYSLLLPVKFNPTVSGSTSNVVKKQDGHKDGGIFTVPHVAWFAEAGPEAAIPLDGSKNAVDLWETTGQLLGVYDKQKSDAFELASAKLNSKDTFGNLADQLEKTEQSYTSHNSSNQFVYNPKNEFKIYGNAPSEQKIEQIQKDLQDNFEEKLDNYFAQKARRGLKDFNFV